MSSGWLYPSQWCMSDLGMKCYTDKVLSKDKYHETKWRQTDHILFPFSALVRKLQGKANRWLLRLEVYRLGQEPSRHWDGLHGFGILMRHNPGSCWQFKSKSSWYIGMHHIVTNHCSLFSTSFFGIMVV